MSPPSTPTEEREALDAALDGAIARVPAFADLGPEERDLLAGVLHPMQVRPGTVVCAEGEPARCCYFIVDGEVEVSKSFGEAGRKVLATLDAGDAFGQLSLVDPGRRSATCTAKGRARLLRLDRDDFERLFHAGSPFAFKFQEAIARAAVETLRLANRRLRTLISAARDQAAARREGAELDEVRVIPPQGDVGRTYRRTSA
jgi:CRP/FNR family cyclic AMP-dependent transcriptional regulator